MNTQRLTSVYYDLARGWNGSWRNAQNTGYGQDDDQSL
jgi:hypothetical protein